MQLACYHKDAPNSMNAGLQPAPPPCHAMRPSAEASPPPVPRAEVRVSEGGAGITSMLNWVKGLAESVSEEGAMATGLADMYFLMEREAVASKRVWRASLTNGVLLQVIAILLIIFCRKYLALAIEPLHT